MCFGTNKTKDEDARFLNYLRKVADKSDYSSYRFALFEIEMICKTHKGLSKYANKCFFGVIPKQEDVSMESSS